MFQKFFNTNNFYHKLSLVSFLLVFAGIGTVYLVISHADAPVAASNQVQADPSCSLAPVGYATCASLVRSDQSAIGAKPIKTTSNNISGSSGDTVGDGGAYNPGEIQAAYNLSTSSNAAGKGAVVAIVDAYDDSSAESDLATYRSFWNLPACTTANGCFNKVNQNGLPGNYPSANSEWQGEISLDLDMVSAICPNCHIVLVEANTNSWDDLSSSENTAYQFGPVAISNSFSGDEGNPEIPFYSSTDASAFNHPGTAIFAATGDAGYNTGGSGQPSGYGVGFPAVLASVTAVGGTTLYENAASSDRMATETAWSGAGSGCSTTQAKPSWQTDTGCKNKTISDVSAVADTQTPVWVYSSGQWWFYGGTSVATPILAGTYALGNNPYNYSPSIPYANKADFNDITSGSNSTTGCTIAYLCTAVAGYDGPTGLGTPNGISGFQPSNLGDVPSVSIATPANATNESSGVFTLSGTASDSSSTITSVAISIDSGTYQTISGTTNWSTTLNPASYSVGLHNITIKATNSAGKSSIASEGLLLGNISPPNAPTSVSGTAVGHTEVDLSWTASVPSGTPITDYQIWQNNLEVGDVTTNSFKVTNIDPNENYTFCIIAINTLGLSSNSVCTPNIFLPPIPGNPPAEPTLTLTGVTTSGVALSWTKSISTIGIRTYFVYSDGNVVGATDGLTNTFTDQTISPSTTYTYYVKAVDLNGTLSPSSNVLSVKTLPASGIPPAITPPSSLSAVTPSYRQVNLSWKAASGGLDGINYYNVFRNGKDIAAVPAPTSSTVTYSDGTLSPITKYSYYVEAVDFGNNTSKPTSTIAITTMAEYKITDLKGKVTNSQTKKPLSGVKITDTTSSKTVYTATSNSSGAYQFSKLPSGKNTLVIKLSGYKTKTVTLTLGAVSTKTYNISLVKG